MWMVIGLLVGGVAGCAAIALIGVLVLQVSVKLVTRDTLGPDRAYATTFYSALAMFIITMLLGIGFSASLQREAREARQEALEGYPLGYWTGEPEAKGIDAVLGWGAAAPMHRLVLIIAVVLSALAWIAILRLRHKIDLGKSLLIVLVSQVIWTVGIFAVWGTWVVIGAGYRWITA